MTDIDPSNAWELLVRIQELAEQAQEALRDEHELHVRQAVIGLEFRTRQLAELVGHW